MRSIKIAVSALWALVMIFSTYSITSGYIQNVAYSQSSNVTEVEKINITVTKTNNNPTNMTITDKNGTEFYIYNALSEKPCWQGPEGGCVPEPTFCSEFGVFC
jgi:hypothetical protein